MVVRELEKVRFHPFMDSKTTCPSKFLLKNVWIGSIQLGQRPQRICLWPWFAFLSDEDPQKCLQVALPAKDHQRVGQRGKWQAMGPSSKGHQCEIPCNVWRSFPVGGRNLDKGADGGPTWIPSSAFCARRSLEGASCSHEENMSADRQFCSNWQEKLVAIIKLLQLVHRDPFAENACLSLNLHWNATIFPTGRIVICKRFVADESSTQKKIKA